MLKIKLFIFCLLPLNGLTQSNPAVDSLKPLHTGYDEKGLAPVLAIHQGTYTFLEGGITYWHATGNGCAFGSSLTSLSLSAEYNPFNHRGGISLTALVAGAFTVMGLNVHSYTDFDKYNSGVRPFLGIGNGLISITYGYNLTVFNKEAFPRNKHEVALRWIFTGLFSKNPRGSTR